MNSAESREGNKYYAVVREMFSATRIRNISLVVLAFIASLDHVDFTSVQERKNNLLDDISQCTLHLLENVECREQVFSFKDEHPILHEDDMPEILAIVKTLPPDIQDSLGRIAKHAIEDPHTIERVQEAANVISAGIKVKNSCLAWVSSYSESLPTVPTLPSSSSTPNSVPTPLVNNSGRKNTTKSVNNNIPQSPPFKTPRAFAIAYVHATSGTHENRNIMPSGYYPQPNSLAENK